MDNDSFVMTKEYLPIFMFSLMVFAIIVAIKFFIIGYMVGKDSKH